MKHAACYPRRPGAGDSIGRGKEGAVQVQGLQVGLLLRLDRPPTGMS